MKLQPADNGTDEEWVISTKSNTNTNTYYLYGYHPEYVCVQQLVLIKVVSVMTENFFFQFDFRVVVYFNQENMGHVQMQTKL